MNIDEKIDAYEEALKMYLDLEDYKLAYIISQRLKSSISDKLKELKNA